MYGFLYLDVLHVHTVSFLYMDVLQCKDNKNMYGFLYL